jgi:hypothetical protein
MNIHSYITDKYRMLNLFNPKKGKSDTFYLYIFICSRINEAERRDIRIQYISYKLPCRKEEKGSEINLLRHFLIKNS